MPRRRLTPAQQAALVTLRGLARLDERRDRARAALDLPREWFPTRRFCRDHRTAERLADLGLVETRWMPRSIFPGSGQEARLTEAGWAEPVS